MIFIMAWRNIWRNKMRSLVIMLSIVIGLFAGLMVLALYKGMLNSRVKTVIESEVGNIQIHDINFKKDYEPFYIIRDGEKILQVLQQLPEIKFIAARTITQGMLSATTGSAGVQINGIIPEKENSISQLNKKIITGQSFHQNKKNEILIGQKLANKMKLKTGSKLVLTFTDSTSAIVSAAFRIAGIYQSDNAPFDERNVYVQQNELNGMLGIGNAMHEIVIILNHAEQTKNIQQQLKHQYNNYQVESWQEISPETDLMVNTVDYYSLIIIAIILFALAFGIINTMLMAILERTREIGMMMALGMNKMKLFMLVLFETFFLTVAGAPIGLAVTWLINDYYNKHGLDWSSMGKEMMSSFGFSSTIYPEFPTEKIPMIIAFVMLTAFISCIYPAIKALQLKPVDALRK